MEEKRLDWFTIPKIDAHIHLMPRDVIEANTGYPIDGEYYDKIFKWASDNNVLVEIHSYPRTHINDDVCSPSRIKNVIKKYSNLKVSVAHMG